MFKWMTLLAAFLLLPALSIAQGDAPPATVDAFVTVRIEGLDHGGMERLNAQVAKDRALNIEYHCLRSGVVVLHMAPVQASERADVITLVRRLLGEANITGKAEFLDVHVGSVNANKC
ncbi:MAG: hypothetical protein IPJ76_09625 [Flavobacteriales bacterium]|nr:MAG: hypothetical protein IPJ76_09625 [Flavobacteriales bacterium]